MKTIIILLLSLSSFIVCSQNLDKKSLSSQIHKIEKMPFSNSGDSTYWDIVKKGLSDLPTLICLLDDTASTNMSVPYFGKDYSIADVSYSIIMDIIYNIPTLELLEESGCQVDKSKGFFNYWDFLTGNESNRKKFKKNVMLWYNDNKVNLVWVKTDMHRYVDFSEMEPFNNPAGGYFILKK